MKIARFRTGNEERYGIVKGDNIAEVEGGLFSGLRPTGTSYPLGQVILLAPAQPVHGSGILGTITFQALESGQTDVVVEDVLLSSKEGESLPLRDCDGDITIQVHEVGADTPERHADVACPPELSATIAKNVAEASDLDSAEEPLLPWDQSTSTKLATGAVCLSVSGMFLLGCGLVVWFVRRKRW